MSEAEPQPAVPKSKLRWFQFSLRTLLVVVTLCDILCSWIGPRIQKAIQESQRASQRSAQYRKAQDAILKAGGEIGSGGHSNGELSLCVYFRNPSISDSDLKPLRELDVPPFSALNLLYIGKTQVTDAGLEHLKGLEHLQELHLEGTKVTQAGVKKLQQALPNCKIEWKPPTPDERQSPAAPDQLR